MQIIAPFFQWNVVLFEFLWSCWCITDEAMGLCSRCKVMVCGFVCICWCLSRSVEWSLRPLARRGCLKAAASTLRPEGQCPCMFRTFMPFAIVHASSGKLRLTFSVKLTCCLMKGMISSNNVLVSSYICVVSWWVFSEFELILSNSIHRESWHLTLCSQRKYLRNIAARQVMISCNTDFIRHDTLFLSYLLIIYLLIASTHMCNEESYIF